MLELTAQPDAADLQALNDGLERFNQASTFGKDRIKVPLTVLLRRDGTVLAAAHGNTHYGWLYLSGMWVEDSLRGRGWGRRLVERFEEEGARRGCHGAWVDTYGFQAPGFYEKLGYREFGRLDEFPPGSARHFYWKPLLTEGRPKAGDG